MSGTNQLVVLPGVGPATGAAGRLVLRQYHAPGEPEDDNFAWEFVSVVGNLYSRTDTTAICAALGAQ